MNLKFMKIFVFSTIFAGFSLNANNLDEICRFKVKGAKDVYFESPNVLNVLSVQGPQNIIHKYRLGDNKEYYLEVSEREITGRNLFISKDGCASASVVPTQAICSSIRFDDVKATDEMYSIVNATGNIKNVVFSQDKKYMAICGTQFIYLYDTNQQNNSNFVCSMSIEKYHGPRYIDRNCESTFITLDGNQIGYIFPELVKFHPTKNRIAFISEISGDINLLKFDALSYEYPKDTTTHTKKPTPHIIETIRVWYKDRNFDTNRIRDIEFDKDGNLFYLECDGNVKMIRNASDENITPIFDKSIYNHVYSIKPSPTDTVIAILGHKGRSHVISLWDYKEGKLLDELYSTERIITITFSPDGKKLACVDRKGVVTICKCEINAAEN